MDERLYQMEAEFLKAISHPTRIRILESLRDGEKCVCEFTNDLDLEQSNTSQHLAVLRRQDIVNCRKEGLKVMYWVNYPQVFRLLDIVKDLLYAQVKHAMDSLEHRDKKSKKE